MPSRHDLLFKALQSFVDTLAARFDVGDVLYGLTDHTVAVLDATTAGVSLVGDDGAKLSKRHGATTVREYREQGFTAALVACVMTSGL